MSLYYFLKFLEVFFQLFKLSIQHLVAIFLLIFKDINRFELIQVACRNFLIRWYMYMYVYVYYVYVYGNGVNGYVRVEEVLRVLRPKIRLM